MVVITGTGRCGTTSMLEYLKAQGIETRRVFGAEINKNPPEEGDKLIICTRRKEDVINSLAQNMPNGTRKEAENIINVHLCELIDYLKANFIDCYEIKLEDRIFDEKKTMENLMVFLKE